MPPSHFIRSSLSSVRSQYHHGTNLESTRDTRLASNMPEAAVGRHQFGIFARTRRRDSCRGATPLQRATSPICFPAPVCRPIGRPYSWLPADGLLRPRCRPKVLQKPCLPPPLMERPDQSIQEYMIPTHVVSIPAAILILGFDSYQSTPGSE